MEIALISCSKKKLCGLHPARELYCSQWFKAARRYVESTPRFSEWYIVSAKWGLVHPSRQLTDYDFTMGDVTRAERLAWGYGVWASLDAVWQTPPPIITLLAGRKYRDALGATAPVKGLLYTPLAGLGIGQQFQWLKRHTHYAD